MVYIVNVKNIDNSYGSFSESFDVNGQSGLLFIHPEMSAATFGMAPTGRYYIYCFYPRKGSCVFIVEQNEKFMWFARFSAPYVSHEFIRWIGCKIENYGK